ncbi:Zn-dependent hydrolase [Ancylobacter sp. TS-1]|uniref:Zn-dependent hydrolase n=1 Tax=Ancylobacter sp. TS-1 TaxID=1850374 RepID=UPI001265B12E|nr:Zn-dependent hydrolase [Ancylobacter sp. TS-1]QFR34146.1 hydantoinase/carbamoylase family amidase [Ancylobacter sp. TS-1]
MPAPTDNLRIDGSRLWDSLMEMAQIGPGLRGGNNRQALTDADREGRLLFRRWCEEAGLTLGVDAMGTMFARRAGTDPDAAPVMIGSHLDTQPTGGKFDGVLGVLGALEVVRTLNDLGIRTRHPVEVVNWTNEEGSRFAPAMVASAVFAGVLGLEEAYARRDAEGFALGAELERIGFKGEEPVGQRRPHAYFELHIEQGPILEDEGVDIGVVTHGQGVRWLEVTLTGRDAHTGSTPMGRRLNAGLGAARIVELVDRIAWSHAPHAVGAVGQLNVYPNSRNIVAGKAVFTIDFRSPDLAILTAMADELRTGAAEIAEKMGLGLSIEEVNAFDPVAFDPVLVGRVREAARQLGYSRRDIVSGAGHDACWVNAVAPAAMIFCPCVDGLSHNEDETIRPEWATAGTDVLLHAVLATAGVAEGAA